MKARYAESLLPISTTTIDPERTYPWGKTRLRHVLCNRPKSGRSWLFAKWDCTTATNGKPPKTSATYSRFLVDPFAVSALADTAKGSTRNREYVADVLGGLPLVAVVQSHFANSHDRPDFGRLHRTCLRRVFPQG